VFRQVEAIALSTALDLAPGRSPRACSSRARSVVARVASCPCNLTHTHSPSDNNKYLLINPQGGGGRGRQHDRKLEHVLGRSHNVRTGAPAALTVG